MEKLNNAKRKVFLSYAFKDFDKINLVSMKLRERGFEIISDKPMISNTNFSDFPIKGIDECDCFILIITDSINEFSMVEYNTALKKGKNTFVYIRKNMFQGDIKDRFDSRIVSLWENEDDLANCIIDDISRYAYSYPQRAYQLELIVNEIFKIYGCLTMMAKRDAGYDIFAEKQNIKLYVETKAFRQKVVDTKMVSNAVVSASLLEQEPNSRFVLVVANKYSHRAQMAIKKNNIIALDISNLLYMVQNDETIKSQLLAILEYSVDDIEPIEPTELLDILEVVHNGTNEIINEKTVTEKLIEEVRNWEPDNRESSEYENLCIRVLKNLFAEDLGLWSDQQRSNEDLYRFDLICKIKDNIQVAFWKFIEEYFRSKYIIFEFKNYTKQITQKEIYTTDKYLYAKALRCVAIIISCEGEDKNAKKAVKGTLRENGKLILCISNKDLIMMLSGKVQGDSPAEYLYGMLDTMLVELDK